MYIQTEINRQYLEYQQNNVKYDLLINFTKLRQWLYLYLMHKNI